MCKILVLQGVPASGKSTWAKEFVKDKKDWVIVSRDCIRESTGNYWVPERENYISELEFDAITHAIKNNLNVIIDATNLNPKTIKKWDELGAKYNIEVEYKLFKISYKEALARDEERGKNGGRAVGIKTIRRFFNNYFPEDIAPLSDDRKIIEYDVYKKDCIICDIDGTIALRNGRSPFDYSKVSEDTFDPRMKRLLETFDPNKLDLIFVSGREGTEQCKEDTVNWICSNLKNSDFRLEFKIFFRKEGDYRNDAIVKKEIYDNLIKPTYNVIAVFDDRNRVTDMWREEGILCAQVYYGDF